MVAPVGTLSPAEDVRVLVLGDDPLARGGLVGLLVGQPHVEIAGHAPPGADDDTFAHVALWDLGPAGQGAGHFDAVPAVALVVGEASAAEAWSRGARGLLRRDADAPRLGAALRAVATGLVALDEGLSVPTAGARATEGLTPREAEVLALLAEGLSNKLIADRLHVSEHTAKFHVNAILAKLGAQGRTEAVVRAARLGWVTL